jgi:hypothetical protein
MVANWLTVAYELVIGSVRRRKKLYDDLIISANEVIDTYEIVNGNNIIKGMKDGGEVLHRSIEKLGKAVRGMKDR